MGNNAPRLLSALVAHLLAAMPLAALADALTVQMITQVPLGQKPKLTVTAQQALSRVEIQLNRDDGTALGENLGAMEAGSSREYLLDGTAGRHHYSGRITFVSQGVPQSNSLSVDTVVGGALDVQLDKSQVDLGAGRMSIRISSPEGKVELAIFGTAGGPPIVEHEQSFASRDPAAPLTVSWTPPPKGTEVGRVDVKVSDPSGAFRSYSLFPWSVYIPHEEVSFATDSAAIAATEAPKLQASLSKIADALGKHRNLGPITLYIAGHTDTVGAIPYNLGLSRRRAQSIAGWFRKQGLRIPIAYEGFGEHAPLVGTLDNTNEPRNRRVDYILAVEDPVLKATDFRPVWKAIK